MEKPTNVDVYIANNEKWQASLEFLRELILSTGLQETVKWAFPTYTLKGKNIVALCAFKAYFGIWFFQGGTLKDDLKVLRNAQEGKTKAMRQWRFTAMEAIDAEAVLLYVEEAIQNQKDGNILKVAKTKKPLIIPPELQVALDKNPLLATHFEAFNLTNQRAFSDYISSAKRIATKEKRLEKIIPMILQGIGLSDKYRK
ncbi:MAG: YdeI family protein [Saprospiraceae bacterium]